MNNDSYLTQQEAKDLVERKKEKTTFILNNPPIYIKDNSFRIKLDKNFFNKKDLLKPIYYSNKILNLVYKLLGKTPKYYETK